MGLASNATMTFVGYTPEDAGVRLEFVCPNPGGGEPSDYSIVLTDAEIAGISSQAQLHDLVLAKLQRQYRKAGFTTKLDPFIGQSLTI